MLRTLNQFFFRDLSFGGNVNDYCDPDNSYLNRVMDRRTGNPISLCLVYLFLARRLGLEEVPTAGHPTSSCTRSSRFRYARLYSCASLTTMRAGR